MPHRFPALIAMLALCAAPVHAQKLTKAEIAKLGKAATALVEVKATHVGGSAFCVHPDGLFVTNEHVIHGGEKGEITLVLNPNLPTQKVVRATVVRSDKDRDLALLRAEKVSNLPTLSLGNVADVSELMDVYAFGFPFGRLLSPDKKEYPAVSANAGSVTALRRKDGNLDHIQLDVAVNPGNSGGPLLDEKGKVVGVIVSGIRGAANINQAIPVSHLAKFLNAPDIEFKPPELTKETRNAATEFLARVSWVLPNAPEPKVQLILKTGDEPAREFPMAKRDGAYVAKAVPFVKAAAETVEIAARFDAGMLSGQTNDVVFKVGSTPVKLSNVRRIEFKPKPLAVLTDGKTVEGEIAGFGAVIVRVGDQPVTMNLAKAIQIQVQAAPEPGVAATVVVSVDGIEFGRVEQPVLVRGNAIVVADPSSVAITPPALAENRVVKMLPEPFADAVLGGGGRYLIFHLPRVKKLAIFDFSEARITKYIPVEEDKVAFAAGLDKLVIGLPKKGVLERWSLSQADREMSVYPTFKDEIKAVFMGHASNGPVAVNGIFLDLATLQPLPIIDDKGKSAGTGAQYHSADGTVFASWNTHQSPAYATTFMLEGNILKRYDSGAEGHNIPGPDGKAAFTAKGVWSATMHRADAHDGELGYCLPAVRGNYFISLTAAEGGRAPRGVKTVGGGSVTVYLLGNSRPIAKPDYIDHGLRFDGWDREEFGAWRRIFFIPQANVIAVLPPSNDQIVLYKFDVDAALEQSGVDYLLVTSQPPHTAKRGTAYSYTIAVKVKRGPATFKLDSGPPGMEVSKTGVVQWPIPANVPEGNQDVILTIKDAAGQEIFHTFTIKVGK